MLGTIGFKGFRIHCIVGIEAQERKVPQDLLVDLKVQIDFTNVVSSEKLEDTIDYVSLAETCRSIAVNGKYLLLEKYASDVLEELGSKFPVKSAWIKIEKPQAIPGAEYALVELKKDYLA